MGQGFCRCGGARVASVEDRVSTAMCQARVRFALARTSACHRSAGTFASAVTVVCSDGNQASSSAAREYVTATRAARPSRRRV